LNGGEKLGRLLLLFVVGAIAMTARFFILGVYDWEQMLTLLLFPAGALVLFFIRLWELHQEACYVPKSTQNVWHTYTREKYATNVKILYKGTEQIATYQRFYRHWWQKVVTMILEGEGKWYMNLSFTMQDNSQITFVEQQSSIWKANEMWHIVRDGEIIGSVKTDYSLKNAVKLQEGLFLQLGDTTYYYKSFGIGSKTEVLREGTVIATGKRITRWEYSFDGEDLPLVMTYILFNYVFSQ
jgi:hypothetical protein